MLKAKFIVSFMILIAGSSILLSDAELISEIRKGLPDGVYLIERTEPFERQFFLSSEEAAAWVENNPGPPEPHNTFFRIYVSGGSYVLQELLEEDDGEGYRSGDLFASESDDGSWTYFQADNTVTIMNTRIDPEQHSGPGVPGAWVNAYRASRMLKLMGLQGVDWMSAKVDSEGRISGSMTNGRLFSGLIEANDNGYLKSMTQEVQGERFDYQILIDREEIHDTHYISEVTIMRRAAESENWQGYLNYKVLERWDFPRDLNMFNFWRQYSNAETRVQVYHPELEAITFHYERPEIEHLTMSIDEIDQGSSGQARSKTTVGFIVALLVLLAFVPIILIRYGRG